MLHGDGEEEEPGGGGGTLVLLGWKSGWVWWMPLDDSETRTDQS